MGAVAAIQAAGHDKSDGTGSIVPALAKTQGRGTHSSGTGRRNLRLGQLPLKGVLSVIACFRQLGQWVRYS